MRSRLSSVNFGARRHGASETHRKLGVMPVPLPKEYDFVWAELERDGEPLTLARVKTGQYSGKKLELCRMWLDWKNQERSELSAARRDAAARLELNTDRRRQNIMIMIAVAAAIIALIAWLYPRPPPDYKPAAPKMESQP